VHRGIFDAVERFAAAAAVADYQIKDLRIWMNMISFSKIAFATTDEITRLKNQSHQDDFAGQGEPIKIPKKHARSMSTLWGESAARLTYTPFLRTRHFLKSMKQFMRI
jgi:hypothetical protein